jgi:hypothetical protein
MKLTDIRVVGPDSKRNSIILLKGGITVKILSWTGIDFEALHSKQGLIVVDQAWLDKQYQPKIA